MFFLSSYKFIPDMNLCIMHSNALYILCRDAFIIYSNRVVMKKILFPNILITLWFMHYFFLTFLSLLLFLFGIIFFTALLQSIRMKYKRTQISLHYIIKYPSKSIIISGSLGIRWIHI